MMRMSKVATEAMVGVGAWWALYALIAGALIWRAEKRRRGLVRAHLAILVFALAILAREAYYVEFQHYKEVEGLARRIQPGLSKKEAESILGGGGLLDTTAYNNGEVQSVEFFPDSPLARFWPYGGLVYIQVWYDEKGRVESAEMNIP